MNSLHLVYWILFFSGFRARKSRFLTPGLFDPNAISIEYQGQGNSRKEQFEDAYSWLRNSWRQISAIGNRFQVTCFIDYTIAGIEICTGDPLKQSQDSPK